MVLDPVKLRNILDGNKTMEIRRRKRKPELVWLGNSGNIYARVRIINSVLLSQEEFKAKEQEHLSADFLCETCWGLQL